MKLFLSALLSCLLLSYCLVAQVPIDTLRLLRRPAGWRLTQVQSPEGRILATATQRAILRLRADGTFRVASATGAGQAGRYELSTHPSNVLRLDTSSPSPARTGYWFLRTITPSRLVLLSDYGAVFTYQAVPPSRKPK